MQHDSAEPFVLRFRLSEEQFRRAHQGHLRRHLFTLRSFFLVTIALMIGMVQAHLFNGATWALCVFAGLWMAIMLFVLYIYFLTPGRIYRRNPGLAGEQELRADESGLSWTAAGISKSLAWSELARASDTPDFIYLYPRYGMPWVLPKAAFESDEKLQAFDRLVGSRL